MGRSGREPSESGQEPGDAWGRSSGSRRTELARTVRFEILEITFNRTREADYQIRPVFCAQNLWKQTLHLAGQTLVAGSLYRLPGPGTTLGGGRYRAGRTGEEIKVHGRGGEDDKWDFWKVLE
jgi:hypothetical protein